MLADVFTKMVKPTVLFDARILVEVKESKTEKDDTEKGASISARIANAALNSSSLIQVEYKTKDDGSIEMKMIIPKDIVQDPSITEQLMKGFGVTTSVSRMHENSAVKKKGAQEPTVKMATQ